MPFDAEREIARAHADAIVDHPDQPPAAGLHCDIDPSRSRVERVLDEFLHGGGRPFDHFARSDAVDQKGVEATNRHPRTLAGRPSNSSEIRGLPEI